MVTQFGLSSRRADPECQRYHQRHAFEQRPFSVTVQVSDSAGIKTTNTFALQIQPAPVQIITASLPPYTSGASYSQTLTATGGSPPFTWSLGSGSLPPGLALDPAGAIRGTPTTAGSYTFSVRVTDSAGASAMKAYAITINGVVSIETNSLADALIGAPYSQLLRRRRRDAALLLVADVRCDAGRDHA